MHRSDLVTVRVIVIQVRGGRILVGEDESLNPTSGRRRRPSIPTPQGWERSAVELGW